MGDDLEIARNAFHAPPLHESCAEALASVEPSWSVVRTAAFEFVRPTSDDLDRRPVFVPSALLDG